MNDEFNTFEGRLIKITMVPCKCIEMKHWPKMG